MAEEGHAENVTLEKKKKGHAKDGQWRPHFYRLMLGDFSRRLRIPSNFVKHIAKETTTEADIKGPSGNIWAVDVFKGRKGTYFQDGWCEFVEDHCLDESDFLMFRHDGNMHFTVQVFDSSSCEKEDAFLVIAGRERKKKRMSSGEFPLQTNMTREKPCSLDGRDMTLPASEMSGTMRKKPDAQAVHGRPLNKKAEGKRKLEAPPFTSQYPSFRKIILALHLTGRSLFRPPFKFSKEHLPDHNANLVLHDPEGRKWDVKYVYKSEKRFFSSNGWLRFLRGNKLREGDACIFELVGKLEMNVHIVRSSGKEER